MKTRSVLIALVAVGMFSARPLQPTALGQVVAVAEQITVSQPGGAGTQYMITSPVIGGPAATGKLTLVTLLKDGACEDVTFFNATGGTIQARNTSSPSTEDLKATVNAPAGFKTGVMQFCCNADDTVGKTPWVIQIGGAVPGVPPDAVLTVNVECPPKIPTVSEWGLIILTLVGMTAGTIMLGRRRRPVTAAH